MRESVMNLKNLAYNAGEWISMDPERFGEHLLDECESGLTDFLGKIPDELHDIYEKRYLEKYSDWLRAMGRCFSVLVVGPANFNNRKHEAANNAERAARERFETWCKKVIKRVNAEHRLTGWAEVERLQNKLEKLTELQEQMKAVNKIVRSTKITDVQKIDELTALGFSEKEANLLNSEPRYSFWKKGFQTYQLTNNNAKIKATKEAIKRHSEIASTDDKEMTFEGGSVELCSSEERIRVFFDEIPDDEQRARLKKNGFKWSPKNKAWQRQMTPNAMTALRHYVKLPGLNTDECRIKSQDETEI